MVQMMVEPSCSVSAIHLGFDPTALEMNSNRNRSNGATFNYAGIKVSGGPAPVGLPIIPVQMNGDNIEGITDYLDWYTYCD